MLNVPLLNLDNVLAAVAAMGGMSGVLSVLRILFLDRLLSGMNATSQNIMLHAVYAVLNFATIIGLSLAMGATAGPLLVVSAIVATAGANGLGHLVFTGIRATSSPTVDTPPDGAASVFGSSAQG